MKEFSSFRLDPTLQCLWRHGSGGAERILLEIKSFGVLQYLVEHAGRLVTQKEIIEAVWPKSFIQPGVLKRHISLIRDTLGDDAKKPIFIETLPRRGYQFIAPIKDTLSAAAPRPLDIKIVGRAQALDELRLRFQGASAGRRQVVFVTGEVGIGKTTVVDEFQRQIASDGALHIARGQCLEGFGGKEAYYPMLEGLDGLCRSSSGAWAVQILATQAPTWLVQFPSLVRREQREALQRAILGATRERMLREIVRALEIISADSTLLLILEDLHWADHSTLDLLSAIARGREPARLLLLCTYRPVDSASIDHPLARVTEDLIVHELAVEVSLPPLAEHHISTYLSADPIATGTVDSLAQMLYRHSDGNPLFMVAVLKHLTQRGFISQESGRWKLSMPLKESELQVPGDLYAMIEAHIGRLSREEQLVLEAASVNGVTFSTSVIGAALAMDEPKVEDLCQGLSRRQLLIRWHDMHQFPDTSVSPRYAFSHALFREVLYRRQAPRRRAKLHFRIGERLQALYAQHENEAAARLAEHFVEGSAWSLAVKYLRFAADAARRRFEHSDAIAILNRALQLVDKLPLSERPLAEVAVLDQLATFYIARFEVGAALEAYQKIVQTAAREGLLDVQIRALVDMALPALWTSAQLYRDTIEQALQLSAKQEDSFVHACTRARCFALRAVADKWRPEDAESFRLALAEIERHGDRLITATHRLEYTAVQWLSSRYEEAHESALANLSILLDQDDFNPYFGGVYLRARWVGLRNLLLWGKWGYALQEVGAETALCQKNGDYTRGQEVRIQAAWVHLYAMDFQGVIECCESIAASVTLPSPLRSWHILMGTAEAGLGNPDRALVHLMKVKDEMDRVPVMDDWYQAMQLQAGFVKVSLFKKDLLGALRAAERFLEVSLATSEHTYRGLAWEANARVAIAQGEWPRAQECIAKALETIEGYDVPLAAWRIHGTAASVSKHAAENAAAERHLVRSIEIIRKLADSVELDHPLRTAFLSDGRVRKILRRDVLRESA